VSGKEKGDNVGNAIPTKGFQKKEEGGHDRDREEKLLYVGG